MNLTPVNEFTAIVPVIDDGDICGNLEHLATAQALANRTEYLRQHDIARYRHRTLALYPASQTVYPASARETGTNVVDIRALSGPVTYTVDSTDAQDGDWLLVANNSTTYNAYVVLPDGAGTTVVIPGDRVEFQLTSGVWGRLKPSVLEANRLPFLDMLMPLPAATLAGSHFSFTPANGWEQATTGGAFSGSYLYFPLGPFPRNQPSAPLYLQEVQVRVQPAVHAFLPGDMPGFYVYVTSPAGLVTLGSVFQDTSPDIATYNAAHDIIGVLGTSFAIDWGASPAIYVAIFGEYAANAATGLKVLGVRCKLGITP